MEYNYEYLDDILSACSDEVQNHFHESESNKQLFYKTASFLDDILHPVHEINDVIDYYYENFILKNNLEN